MPPVRTVVSPSPEAPEPVYLGLDPGASGGIASLYRGGLTAIAASALTLRDLWEWLRPVTPGFATYAVLEKVGGFVKGNATPGSAMFNFGANYGALEMALVAAGIPYEVVTPAVWQKGLGVPGRKKNESKTAWKNRLKARAQALFPGAKVTLATADALLIAEYCRRKREGTL